MLVHYFSPDGWEGCSLRGRPAIRDKMPVLIDEDLRFEDVGVGRATGHAETRKSLSTNGLRTGTPNQLRQQQWLDMSHAGISGVADLHCLNVSQSGESVT